MLAGGKAFDIGVGQTLQVCVAGVGGGDEEHSSPALEDVALLVELLDEVLGGFAVRAEEGQDAA